MRQKNTNGDREKVYRYGLVAWLSLWLAFAASGGSPRRYQPVRNIVLVSIDTLRADHLGCYGYFRDTSPVIDEFAEGSIFFELGLSPLSTTLPAHTSLLTGVHPLEHGILANIKAGKQKFVPRESLQSFASFARRRGFMTAGFVSAAPLTRPTGFNVGFETFDEPDDGQRSATVTNESVFEWIDGVGKEPFFLFVHYFDPHTPYSPPQPFAGMFQTDTGLENYVSRRNIPESLNRPNQSIQETRAAINAYDGEIRYVDHEFGRLLDALKSHELLGSTAIVLLSDHGEGLGEHGMAGHGYIHREQLHVPLMMYVPGREGRRVAGPVSLMDVLPTLLGQIGTDGWSRFLDQSSGHDVLALGSRDEPVLSLRSSRSREDLHGPSYSLASRDWKYVHEPEVHDRLFDWSADPLELHDVLGQQSSVGDRMRPSLLDRVRKYEERGRLLGIGQEDEETDMDPELLEKLRSLGYVE